LVVPEFGTLGSRQITLEKCAKEGVCRHFVRRTGGSPPAEGIKSLVAIEIN
jgi:hypothetical protein